MAKKIPVMTVRQRNNFCRKVNLTADCWEWTGYKKNEGYGYFTINDGEYRAHRVMWHVFNGAIPDGLCILHRCDNPGCVNPSHLWLGTITDNNKDCYVKGRRATGEAHGSRTVPGSRATGDRNGSRTRPERLARGERNKMTKLTESKVVEIRSRYAAGGVTLKVLGSEYGVDQSLIHQIVRFKAWKYVR